MKPDVPTCNEIELICAQIWGWRTNIIVPNVSWGAGVHECDLLVLSKASFATEIEIKRSLADLKKDATKRHGHTSERIKYLYFALPSFLLKHENLIPQRAGIVEIRLLSPEHPEWGWTGAVFRHPRANPSAKAWTQFERMNLGRLGSMRIWSLTKKLIDKKINASSTLPNS